METGKLFVRKASGLVRGMTGTDALIGNMLLANLIFGAVGLLFVPSTYPGSSMTWSIVFAIIAAIFLDIVYVLFGSTFPLSGGDYVFNSRSLFPSLGFAGNMAMIMPAAIFITVYANWSMTIGMAGFLSTLGLMTNSPGLIDAATWVSLPNTAFVIATLLNIAIMGIVLTGLRPSMVAQKVLWTVGMIGVCVAIFVIAFTPHDVFVSRFDAFTSYFGVIDTAAQEGFPVIPQWNDLSLSLVAIGYSGLTVLYTQNNVYAGGELQNPKRNMRFSIFGSLAILAPLTLLMAYGMQYIIGDQFLASLYYLQLIGKSPLPVPASYNLFAGVAAANQVLVWVMGLGFILWPLGTMIFVYTFASRSVMAWSFDRVLPDKFSEVSRKYHSPTYAILLIAVLSEAALVLYTYSVSFVSWIAGITVSTTLTYFITSIAGIVFAYRRKKLYKGSPAQREIGGVPLITIAGVISTVFMFLALYGLIAWPYTFPPYTELTTTDAILTRTWFVLASLVFFWGAFIIYYVSKYVRKRQGIDLDLIYSEVPPA
jgi:amino acid transporter